MAEKDRFSRITDDLGTKITDLLAEEGVFKESVLFALDDLNLTHELEFLSATAEDLRGKGLQSEDLKGIATVQGQYRDLYSDEITHLGVKPTPPAPYGPSSPSLELTCQDGPESSGPKKNSPSSQNFDELTNDFPLDSVSIPASNATDPDTEISSTSMNYSPTSSADAHPCPLLPSSLDEGKDLGQVESKCSGDLSPMEKCKQRMILENSLFVLGLNKKQVEGLIQQKEKFLKRPNVVSKRLKMSEEITVKALDILKAPLTQETKEKIENCIRENPEYDNEDIAIDCDISEDLVSQYFEILPLSLEQKQKIEERFNRGISGNDIANILKIPTKKVDEYVEILSEYLLRYSMPPLEYDHYAEHQTHLLRSLTDTFGTNVFSSDKYRTIITQSFDELIARVESSSKSSEKQSLLMDLLPLAFYYIKCSLPFEDIAQILANVSDITTHEVFHLIFQRSDPVIRGLCIEHYSFSNPVPLYYPKLSHSSSTMTKFEFCKELWYCIEQHYGLISFGLGRAGWNPVGKSHLLDMIFQTDFEKGNSQRSAFHLGSIDIQMTRNLYGKVDVTSKESTNWAYIDCHRNSKIDVIRCMCSYLDIALIHVCHSDFTNNKEELEKELSEFVSKMKHIYLLVRDSESSEIEVLKERVGECFKTTVFLPNLTCDSIKTHSIVKQFKYIGYGIFHIETPKLIKNAFILNVMNDLECEFVGELQTDMELIDKITQHILANNKTEVDFNFLNYYPKFVAYMCSYRKASHETKQAEIDQLNAVQNEIHAKLLSTSRREIVLDFNKILMRKHSILILWKLSRELFHLTNSLTSQGRSSKDKVKEQKTDRYTVEILWREALLSHKYANTPDHNYSDNFASNFSKHVENGEAFELIDGDNLRFFNQDIDALLCEYYENQIKAIDIFNKNSDVKLKPAPIVVSIFGPQSSGKSTLLNYCFGCKFLSSAGRCTKGIYGSISKLDRPINLSDSFLILDTEGLDSIEREDDIHFDRTMVLFCLSVSQVVIINIKGDIGNELQNLLQICAYSLNSLKVSKVKTPKIFFVLNQQADPDSSKHLKALNIFLEKLNSESFLTETGGVKIADLMQVSEENLFILPCAFNSQNMNKPGAKLFDSNIIKLSPTILFADECAKLRLAVIEQLERIPLQDRISFQTMSEWMEMAGVIWDTIIKYQDIVKYKNLEELICSKKFGKIITDLMDEHIHGNQKVFTNLTNDICEEIERIEVCIDPDDYLTELMMRFDNMFGEHKKRCLNEFENIWKNDKLLVLERMEHIRNEKLSYIKRIIYVVRKQHEDQLKLQIKFVFTELKLSECMKNFQETIVQNVDAILTYSIGEQEKSFEGIWNLTFGAEDHEEEIRERDSNFSTLYSIFREEYSEMEDKQTILFDYRSLEFNMDTIIQSIRTKIMSKFQHNTDLSLAERFIYPIECYSTIKDMKPYLGDSSYSYLSQHSLYTVTAKRHFFVFSQDTIVPHSWIPEDCMSLLQHCSGLVNHPDIHWKTDRKQQILKLASILKCPEDTDKSIWEKFINEISTDILDILNTNETVSPAVVKLILHVLCSRMDSLDYEINFINASLSNVAVRTLSSFAFAFAFKFLWEKKAIIRSKNVAKRDQKKHDLHEYFMQKIENRKIVRGTDRNQKTMAKSDIKISQKYALDYIASAKRGLITSEQKNYLTRFLEERKDSLSHDSILALAEDLLVKELTKDPRVEVTDTDNFAVQFICNRNHLVKSMFLDKWREIETTLHSTISQNVKRHFSDKKSNLINVLTILLSKLEKSTKDKNFVIFDSDSNFEIAEAGTHDLSGMKELPFKAMNHFFKMYLDPNVTAENFMSYPDGVFELDGLKVKKSDTYSLCLKPDNPRLDEDTFKKLCCTEMFNETIFNLYKYVEQFKAVIEGYSIEVTKLEFQEMTATLKDKLEKNVIGCPKRCPSCGKCCEREIHANEGKCQIKTGHQISSMGGKVWNADAEKTAVLFVCDDYKDYTHVILPSGSIRWGEFKEISSKDWLWTLPTEEKYKTKQQFNQQRMQNVWNKFGRGILNYYKEKEGTQISFVPYTSYQQVNQPLLPVNYFICFVIDGTGSMARDISSARVSVGQLIEQFISRGSSSEFRIVIYRDHCDEEIIQTFPDDGKFTSLQNSLSGFLSEVSADGGGDFPEAVLDGLATAATKSDWKSTSENNNKIIHIFDAPPHGNFPDYKLHYSKSNSAHCCCCNQGKLCHFDWERDVWDIFKKFNIEYHGISTGKRFDNYETKMKEELGHLCGDFQLVGKEVVNDAILRIFLDFKS